MSTARKFNAAVSRPAPYVFDYDAEVAEFYAARPDMKDRLYFVDMKDESFTVTRPGQADAAEKDEALHKNFHVTNGVRMMGKLGVSFALRAAGPDYGVIALAQQARRQGLPRLMGAGASNDEENLFVFDHEIGHMVCKNGGPAYFNLRECAADAYATIRHIQRLGLSDTVRAIADTRAVELVFRPDNGDHFTSPVTEAILADAEKMDFTALDAKQTAELANRYALAHVLNTADHANAAAAFKALRGRLPELAAGDAAPLRALADIVLETDSPTIFRWGAKAIRALLDGKILCDGIRIQPPASEWEDVRLKLAARDAEHARDGLRFGLNRPPVPANGNKPTVR